MSHVGVPNQAPVSMVSAHDAVVAVVVEDVVAVAVEDVVAVAVFCVDVAKIAG